MRIHVHNGLSRSTGIFCLLAVAQISNGIWVTISSIQSTCPARSINYITQTLPQQCLTSSWASKPIAQTAPTEATNSQAETSTGVPNIKAPPTVSADTALIPSTHGVDSTAGPVSTPSISEADASQTATTHAEAEKGESSATSSQENDFGSPLDDSKFLSFEEWKLQNLAKAGQSTENLGQNREGDASEQRRRPSNINNALEAFGEDSEIDIDFSGFVNAGGMNEALPIQSSLPVSSTGGATTEGNAEDLSNNHKRNKDAGKTCKERSNYASFDCAATVLKTNPECKSATSVLVESKDNYMLNVCSAKNKFFIVELCDDILIDTVVLANFEFFSSMFKTFRISVSDRYPVKMDRWKELGVFEAQNTRAIQAFLVENPLIWARYLRIELLTHFGAEYYCPLSLLRVHGTTMMEEFNHELKGSRSEDDPEDETEEISNEATMNTLEPSVATEESSVAQKSSEQVLEMASSLSSSSGEPAKHSASPLPSITNDVERRDDDRTEEDLTPYKSPSLRTALEDMFLCKNDRTAQCPQVHKTTAAQPTPPLSSTSPGESQASSLLEESLHSQNDRQRPSEPVGTLLSNASVNATSTASSLRSSGQPLEEQNRTAASTNTSNSTTKSLTTSLADTDLLLDAVDSGTALGSVILTASGTDTASSQPFKANSMVPSSIHESPAAAVSSSSTPSAPSPATAVSATIPIRPPSSSTLPPAANPSTQESFFKSVHKRLQQLEANSTLSLQYIEEQSRILRDAFSSVEKRQLSKTSAFLETLNNTVLTELRDFRMQYDQIWQSTVLELSSQREQSAQQVSILSTRMTFLADEIVFQKRIAMVQFLLILLCLGLVVFSRPGRTSTYLELPPLVHNAIKRSSANLARYTQFETPPASPSPSRPPSEGLSSKYGLFHRKSHRRTPSDESDPNGGLQSPVVAYSPPSPQSQVSHEDREASPSGRSTNELEPLSIT